ncbi:hypothetical protein AAAC51_36520 [Priestia megaterium]|nr:hypothetical protein [Priestia megaterium NBRC 15308 = ATCC 14581]
MKYVCPVCGYKNLEEAAYDESGLASFEICICCGFQFGDDDDVEIEEGVFMDIPETHRLHRKNGFRKVLLYLILNTIQKSSSLMVR